MQQEYAAKTNKHRGHATDHAAWTVQRAHAARTCNMDMHHGHAARTCI
jgi:hypothetical protein